MKTTRLVPLALLPLLVACGGEPVTVGGHAFDFGAGGTIEGATISVLEQPELSTTTLADGSWTIEGLRVGDEASFVLDHADYAPIQTGTHAMPEGGIDNMTFQAPTYDMYELLATFVDVDPAPNPDYCQIATTVTRRGNSLYDETPGTHGEPGATVTIEPARGIGPVYFNLSDYKTIWPDWDLTETTDDGGVLFLDLPPGDYTLTAHKDGTVFAQTVHKCRGGVVVNASPPWGLQALEGGVGPRQN